MFVKILINTFSAPTSSIRTFSNFSLSTEGVGTTVEMSGVGVRDEPGVYVGDGPDVGEGVGTFVPSPTIMTGVGVLVGGIGVSVGGIGVSAGVSVGGGGI